VFTRSSGAPFQCGIPGANACVKSMKRWDFNTANASVNDIPSAGAAAATAAFAAIAATTQRPRTQTRMLDLPWPDRARIARPRLTCGHAGGLDLDEKILAAHVRL